MTKPQTVVCRLVAGTGLTPIYEAVPYYRRCLCGRVCARGAYFLGGRLGRHARAASSAGALADRLQRDRGTEVVLGQERPPSLITFSNGYAFEYMVASGLLAFDGRGWAWEHPLRWIGALRPDLFTVVTKTLTREPRPGNLRWSHPWSCARLLRDGSMVNAVGLTNPGIGWWCREVGPRLDPRIPLVGSIYGDTRQLVEIAEMLNDAGLVGLEVNVSCPNTGNKMEEADAVVAGLSALAETSHHPLICKLSVVQDYVGIAGRLEGAVQALSFNSVPWKLAFPGQTSPLAKLGGGGVSGRAAQPYSWRAMAEIVESGCRIPVIASSIMEYDDLARVRALGASAVSFGSIHMLTPWKPTAIVRRDMAA